MTQPSTVRRTADDCVLCACAFRVPCITRQHVPPSRDAQEQPLLPLGTGGQTPTHRVFGDGLTEQRLDRRVNLRDPHRPSLVGHHFTHGIQNPTWTARPLTSTHDGPWLGIAGPETSQLLGKVAQSRPGLLRGQRRQKFRHNLVDRARILVPIPSAPPHCKSDTGTTRTVLASSAAPSRGSNRPTHSPSART
jgi:hypothetical protein